MEHVTAVKTVERFITSKIVRVSHSGGRHVDYQGPVMAMLSDKNNLIADNMWLEEIKPYVTSVQACINGDAGRNTRIARGPKAK